MTTKAELHEARRYMRDKMKDLRIEVASLNEGIKENVFLGLVIDAKNVLKKAEQVQVEYQHFQRKFGRTWFFDKD